MESLRLALTPFPALVASARNAPLASPVLCYKIWSWAVTYLTAIDLPLALHFVAVLSSLVQKMHLSLCCF